MTSIGDRAYAGTLYSEAVTIPESIEYMGSEVFDGCTITSIYAPWVITANVATIEPDTFPDDFLLGDVYTISVPAAAVVTVAYDLWDDYFNVENVPSDSFYVSTSSGNLEACLIDQVVGIGASNPLIVAGTMNADDFTYLKSYADENSLKYLDLTGVTIDPELLGEMPASSFEGCTKLSTCALPASVFKIGERAFYGCILLSEVTWDIPGGDATVGASAFEGCSIFASITDILSANVATIEDRAFYGCTAISTMRLPSKIMSYGEDVFTGCSKISSIYTADVSAVEYVPTITSTTFPEAFRTGGSYEITIPELSLQYFTGTTWTTAYKSSAYSGAFDASTTTLRFELDSPVLDSDDDKAFYADVPTSWGTLETAIKAYSQDCSDAYDAGTAFGKLIVTGNINVGDFKAMQNRFKSIDMSGATVVGYLQEYWANSSLTDTSNSMHIYNRCTNGNIIPYYGFSADTALEELIIPPTVTRLAAYCFYGCSKLRTTNVPESCTLLSNSCFGNCASLTSVSFDEGCALPSTAYSCFIDCTSLKTFTIPEYLVSIGYYTFKGSGLTAIDIPETVTTFTNTSGIQQTFYGCDNLDMITVHWAPADVPEMYQDLFPLEYVAGGDKDIFVPLGSVVEDYTANTTNGLGLFGVLQLGDQRAVTNTIFSESTEEYGETSIAEAVETIRQKCEDTGKENMGEIKLGGALNRADFEVLRNAEFISIDLSEATSICTGELWSGASGPCIPEDAFAGNTTIQTVILQNLVYSVGDRAFMDCTALTSVTLPSNSLSITYVGDDVFNGCTALSAINNTKYMRSVGARAFANSGVLGVSNTSLDVNGSPLIDISMLYPAVNAYSMDGIGDGAFEGCSGLTYVYFPWATEEELPEFGTDILPDSFKNGSTEGYYIMVPDGTTAIYSELDAVYTVVEESKAY